MEVFRLLLSATVALVCAGALDTETGKSRKALSVVFSLAKCDPF